MLLFSSFIFSLFTDLTKIGMSSQKCISLRNKCILISLKRALTFSLVSGILLIPYSRINSKNSWLPIWRLCAAFCNFIRSDAETTRMIVHFKLCEKQPSLVSQKTMTCLNWIWVCFYVYTTEPMCMCLCISGFENMNACSSLHGS